MKVYHCTNARSLRVIWAAEELGLDLEVQGLQFPPRVREQTYLDVVPTGVIPSLEDGDVRLLESIAICEYLAHTYADGRLTLQAGQAGWTDYLQFLHMGEATLVPPLTQIVRYRMLEPPERRLPQAVQDGAALFMERLQPVAARLERADYMAGDNFSLADISVGYALALGAFLRLGKGFPLEVTAYLDRLRARPAFERAMARNEVAKAA